MKKVENRCSRALTSSFSQSVTMKHVYFLCWVGDTVGNRQANLIDFLACGSTNHNGNRHKETIPTEREEQGDLRGLGGSFLRETKFSVALGAQGIFQKWSPRSFPPEKPLCLHHLCARNFLPPLSAAGDVVERNPTGS